MNYNLTYGRLSPHILHYSDNAFPTLDATALHPIEEAIYST